MTSPPSGRGSYGLHWFRRDLRVAGNPALRWNWGQHQGRVLGLFCFDAKFLARPDFSTDRFAFFLATLTALRDDLREAGGDLLVLDQRAADAFAMLFEALDRRGIARPSTVSFNRDYEPFARARDEEVTTLLSQRWGVEVHTERDHLLIEPDEIRQEGEGRGADDQPRYYQVFTAFARRWFALLATPRIQQRLATEAPGLSYVAKRAEGANASSSAPFALTWAALFGGPPPLPDHLDRFVAEVAPRARVPLPRAGSVAAHERLQQFAQRLPAYKTDRDAPGIIDGTSGMSIYFKNGSLTVAQAIAALKLGDARFDEGSGRSAFVRELCWREFYYHLLWYRPDVEGRAFLPQFREIAWENREDWFESWKAGRTGYPLVDAGMRELAETGRMHNRVRMVVASFLTKDLLIDWRWGERYFMERLLDGDLAANNGGWQWAASTGCDAQPYFRVFNPTLQSQRFDPQGTYLRRFLPERRDDDDRTIHLPKDPIVDHAAQKAKALAIYRSRDTARGHARDAARGRARVKGG